MPVPLAAGKEGGEAQSARALSRKTPFFVDTMAFAEVNGDGAQNCELRSRQDEVLPGGMRFDALGEGVEAPASLDACAVPQSRHSRVVRSCLAGGRGRISEGVIIEMELARGTFDAAVQFLGEGAERRAPPFHLRWHLARRKLVGHARPIEGIVAR